MRNVALVCLDTVRQDYFAAHAPRLQERADVSFAQCRAASSWSAPSHASMFTGRLPSEHGVHAHARTFTRLDAADTFVGDLPGHRALGASANVWAGSSFGFDDLFDEFSDISPDRRFPDGIDVARFGQECDEEGFARGLAFLREALAHDDPARSLANGALVGLDRVLARLPIPKLLDDGASTIAREALGQVRASEEPFVHFTNFMDAHGPLHHVRGYDGDLHDAPLSWTSGGENWADVVERGDEGLLERYRGLYAAAIDYLDRKLVTFIDDVQAATDRETTVVVTADHGDYLAVDGEDGRWGHTRSTLGEALLHVPCVVVNAPEGAPSDPEGYFSHLQLRELVVALANDEWPSVTRDRIPAERVGDSSKVHVEKDPVADRMVRCVYDGDRKFEWDSLGDSQAFELDADRPNWERPVDEDVPVGTLEPDFFETDVETYKRQAESGTAMDDVDGATRDRLEELGYL